MAKPGAGKRKIEAVRKKQWNQTTKSLNRTFRYSKRGSRKKNGCYIATCVYENYDCPQVWTLRRFRDETLENLWLGRCFISLYYAVSPVIVRIFGRNKAIRNLWKTMLDPFVVRLNQKGISDAPYYDK